MVGKMPNVIWPSGTFNDSVKEWQQQWFYITEPRDTEWAAAPEFRSGAPLRLTSWPKKGLNWSSPDELSALQTHVKDMEDKNIKLVNIVQVMLVRRILPCQHKACNLWEFDPGRRGPSPAIRELPGIPDLALALASSAVSPRTEPPSSPCPFAPSS